MRLERGRTRREAEWLALVGPHSGVFPRSQYLAFISRANPALAHRFIRRCRQYKDIASAAGSRASLARETGAALAAHSWPGTSASCTPSSST